MIGQVLGWLATICFALLLTPQIILNQSRRSTEGLSLSLIILWHLAAILILPYLLYHHEPIALVVQWSLFTLASIIIELQFVAFRKKKRQPPPSSSNAHADTAANDHQSTSILILAAWACLAFTSSIIIIWGLYALFHKVTNTSSQWVIETLGSALSSVALAVGFLPQIYLMFKEKSSEGFSMGLSFLDLLGSTLSIFAVILKGGGHGHATNVGAIVPYAVIVGFQVIMVFLAVVIFPDPKRFAAFSSSSSSSEEGGGEKKKSWGRILMDSLGGHGGGGGGHKKEEREEGKVGEEEEEAGMKMYGAVVN